MSQSNRPGKQTSQASMSASASASASNVSNTNNGADNARYVELSEAEAAKVDLSAVKWEDAVEHHTKNTLRNLRRVEYDVPEVGVVAEEWRIQLLTVDGQTAEEVAIHSVYVNGQLVRQVDMKSGQVQVAEAAYAPFDFLRYDAYGSTEGGEGGSPGKGQSQVPVISSSKKGAKENGGGGQG